MKRTTQNGKQHHNWVSNKYHVHEFKSTRYPYLGLVNNYCSDLIIRIYFNFKYKTTALSDHRYLKSIIPHLTVHNLHMTQIPLRETQETYVNVLDDNYYIDNPPLPPHITTLPKI